MLLEPSVLFVSNSGPHDDEIHLSRNGFPTVSCHSAIGRSEFRISLPLASVYLHLRRRFRIHQCMERCKRVNGNARLKRFGRNPCKPDVDIS